MYNLAIEDLETKSESTPLVLLKLKPLEAELLPNALELDLICLGGLWTMAGYQRELASPNSQLLALSCSTPGTLDPNNQSTEPEQTTAERLLGLGCLWSILEEAHITVLAVHPDYRRQGFGQALLYSLLRSAWQKSLERATLEVRISNRSALSLYQKFGFEEAGRRRHYYPDTGEDGLILWRGGLQRTEFEQTLTQWLRQIESRLSQGGWSLQCDRAETTRDPSTQSC